VYKRQEIKPMKNRIFLDGGSPGGFPVYNIVDEI
jgi:hypothetical protein